jgi:hypothetical protein
MATIVFYEGNDGVAAWYQDGRLMGDGELHTILEQVFAEVGVEHRMSNEFLMGTDGRGTAAAPTLAAIELWTGRRADDKAEVARLRKEANLALAKAAQIESRIKSTRPRR